MSQNLYNLASLFFRVFQKGFQAFYNALSDKDFLIYPGKLTVADTFRIGCIGNLDAQDMKDTLVAVKEVISDLKINL